jgi:hypothetical protein
LNLNKTMSNYLKMFAYENSKFEFECST